MDDKMSGGVKRTNRGWFKPGNDGGPGAPPGGHPGAGVPPKRLDLRTHLRRALETPSDQLCEVSFSPAERIARKLTRALEEELEGESLVRSVNTVAGTAYGNLVVTEAADHASGQAARDKVSDLLERAAELRRRAQKAKGPS